MSALDTIADKAQAASRRFAGQGGLKGKLADELAEDAVFIRKLKPSLIKARATGRQPTSTPPRASQPAEPPAVAHNSGKPKKNPGSGPNPFLVVGAALVVGVAVAKFIDWRGHVHPR